MSVGTFKMHFFRLYLKSYEKFTFSTSDIMDCKLWHTWAKSRLGPDRFEINVPKLPCKPMFMLLSLLRTIRHFFGL